MALVRPMEEQTQKKISVLERIASSVDLARRWVVNGFRMGGLMARGAYLLGERKTLFHKLGQETYKHYQLGEITHSALDPIIRQLDRLNKKVEIEETLIENLRYGVKHHTRRHTRSSDADSPSKSASR